MVGVKGFEPSTSCSQSRRASQTALHPDALIILAAGHSVNGVLRANGPRTFRGSPLLRPSSFVGMGAACTVVSFGRALSESHCMMEEAARQCSQRQGNGVVSGHPCLSPTFGERGGGRSPYGIRVVPSARAHSGGESPPHRTGGRPAAGAPSGFRSWPLNARLPGCCSKGHCPGLPMRDTVGGMEPQEGPVRPSTLIIGRGDEPHCSRLPRLPATKRLLRLLLLRPSHFPGMEPSRVITCHSRVEAEKQDEECLT